MSDAGIEVDKLTTYDFITQVFTQVEPEILRGLGKKLNHKSARFKVSFDKKQIKNISIERFKAVAKTIFSIKKKSRKWDDETIRLIISNIDELLHGTDELENRFNEFCNFCTEVLKIKKPYEFASEILYFFDPIKYWLWSKWMYDPSTKTGALTLVLVEQPDLEDVSFGEWYLFVGKSVEEIDIIADEIGIREPNTPRSSLFEIPIFLCAVFAVYMYTVTRMRMTKEFNTILPKMVELIRRLLGIYKFEEIIEV